MSEITTNNAVFVMLSFEGPDLYSQAGGLGVRATELCRTLAELGFETHLFFVGDPQKVGEETMYNGKLHLHRWCQWISQYHPSGVYENENGKLWDFEKSVPEYIAENIVKPAAAEKKVVVVMGEEWHTTSTLIRLNDLLFYSGFRDKCVFLWNANNIFSFWRIDWNRLRAVSTITTVSRYMKHYMWAMGMNPLTIPNGIPCRLLERPSPQRVKKLRGVFGQDMFLVKIGRYDPDKRWIMAINALAEMKRKGYHPHMVMRGGMEPHRGDILARASSQGLSFTELRVSQPTIENCIEGLLSVKDFDLIELRFFVPEEFLRLLYASADAVLANSGHEPFGIVGLEVMACGGLVFTGSTGEDYADSFQNSIVLETEDPREIVSYLINLELHPKDKEWLRDNGRKTAQEYTWEKVAQELFRKIEFVALLDGVELPNNKEG